ncbi:MAG: hypothetical protein RLY30_1570 [Pseudomonadota bacterium]
MSVRVVGTEQIFHPPIGEILIMGGMVSLSPDRSDFEALSAGLREASAPQDSVARAVYQSRSLMSSSEHSELLVQCHRNNRKLGLTGLLVIQGERIVQILEGPSHALDATLEKISVDARHCDFQSLEVSRNVPRLFPGWAMGSVVLSASSMSALIHEVESASDEERRRLASIIRDGVDASPR